MGLQTGMLYTDLPGLPVQTKQTEPAVLFLTNMSHGAVEVAQHQPGEFKQPLLKTPEAPIEC